MLAGLKKLNLFFENKTLSQNRRRLLPRRRPQPRGGRWGRQASGCGLCTCAPLPLRRLLSLVRDVPLGEMEMITDENLFWCANDAALSAPPSSIKWPKCPENKMAGRLSLARARARSA